VAEWWAFAGDRSWEFCLEPIACGFGRGFSWMVADKKDWIFVNMVHPDFSGSYGGGRSGPGRGNFVGSVGDRVFWVV
jgi:hypothetical protein